MKLDASKFTRDEKLLLLLSIQLAGEEDSEQSETIDWILHGRRGLFDYSDEELDEELAGFEVIFKMDVPDLDPQKILALIQEYLPVSVSQENRDWRDLE